MLDTFAKIFPLLFYMLAGYLCRMTGMLSEEVALKMNSLVFRLLIPFHLFLSIGESGGIQAQHGPAIFLALGLVAVYFAFANWKYGRQDRPGTEKSVLIQNVYRSNFALFGLAFTDQLMEGPGTGVTESLITVIIPIFNILTVLVFQYYSGEPLSLGRALKKILQNPLILGIAAGYVYHVSGLKLPDMVALPIEKLGDMATPLALLALGACFRFDYGRQFASDLAQATVFRLLIVPGIALSAAHFLGLPREVLIGYIALFASPVAVSSYSMAVSMGQNYELAGQILVYTSLFSPLSLFALVGLLQSFAWI